MPDKPYNGAAYKEAEARIERAKRAYALRLDLSGLSLGRLPESIGQLVGVLALNLSGNQLSSLPESIRQLTDLQALDLRNNELSALPESIASLTGLQSLSLAGNQLSALPEWIGQFTDLHQLYLYRNQLRGLPKPIGQLTRLQALDLDNNQLSALPESIRQLTRLQRLYLSGNQLSVLPKWIDHLTGLQTLTLTRNQLSALPISLFNLKNLKRLFLHGNPALDIPQDALGPFDFDNPKPPNEILDYYFSTRGAQGVALREFRLIVVGSPKVGKTTLLRRLKGLPMKVDEPETHGIDIIPVEFLCQDGSMQARAWDFGGQHVLHAMHEFFLRRRCLYLLVVEQRTNMVERELTYWLQLIRSYAGEAPVVVALNQSKGIERPLAKSALERDYPPIVAWVPTECAPGYEKTIEALRAALTSAADGMEEPRKLFPRKWVEIKNWLEKMTEPYLDYDVFAERCKNLGEASPEQQEALAALMDEMGIALNFARDPRLHDTSVLRPNWLANGIYTLLRGNIITSQPLVPDGILTLEKVAVIFNAAKKANVLDTTEYPSKVWDFLLRLMNLFQLSFPIDAEGKQFLAPLLLPADEPANCEEPAGTDRVKLRYEFIVVPGPLIGRLLVRLFPMIDGKRRWQRGACLRYPPAYGRVWMDLEEKYLFVTVAGPEKEREELLQMVREHLKDLFAEYDRLRVVEQWWHQENWVPRAMLESIGELRAEEAPTAAGREGGL